MKAAYMNNPIKSFDEINFGQLPKPNLRPGHALIKIKVAAANPLDVAIALGRYKYDGSYPYIFGADFSGIIESVGEGVSDFKSGDEVFALNWSSGKMFDDVPDPIVGGAYAEYLVLPTTKLSKKPAEISFELAASLPAVGTTAYQGLLTIGKATAGSRVLIFGGSSACGAIAIQLGKLAGAHVTTTASTRALDFVKQFNPDKIINYNQEKWEDDPALKNVDIVFDAIGEKDGLHRAISSGVAKAGGVYVSIVDFSLGFNYSAHPPLAWAGAFSITQSAATQNELAKLACEGKLNLPIDAAFPFAKDGVVAIFEKVASGKSQGKNLLKIS